MNPIRFTIIGDPEPQGSARGFVTFLKDDAGKLRWHPKTRLPLARAVITSDNPQLKVWRATVARAAQLALGDVAMEFTGGVGIEAMFHIAAPQHMPRDRGGLPIVRPDLDKLARGLLDGLTGVVWHDDEQVVDLVVRKRYAPHGELPRVDVTITPIDIGLPLFPDAERISHAAARRASGRRIERAAASTDVPW
jgi:Holliday junction resolvase RusA-like endonuclease